MATDPLKDQVPPQDLPPKDEGGSDTGSSQEEKKKHPRKRPRKRNEGKTPKKSTKGDSVGIASQFNQDVNKYTIGNLVKIDKDLISLNSGVEIEKRFNVVHMTVDITDIIEQAFVIPESQVKQISAGIIAQLGYAVDATYIEQFVSDLKAVLLQSVIAHASFAKMLQIQNGRQAEDVLDNPIGTALFKMNILGKTGQQNAETYTEPVSYTGLKTSFDDKISNAVWFQDYVAKLDYTYTNRAIRELIAGLFIPVYDFSKGITPSTTFANLWPSDGAESLKVKFNAAVTKVKQLIAAKPLLASVLPYFDFEIGTDLDCNRDLAQKTILINKDTTLVELLTSTDLGTRASIYTPDLVTGMKEDLDNVVFSSIDGPFSTSVLTSLDVISLYSLLNGSSRITGVSEHNIGTDKTTEYIYSANQMIQIKDYHTFMTTETIDYTNKETILANIQKYNELAVRQNNELDFEITHTVIFEAVYTPSSIPGADATYAISNGTLAISTGYGTYLNTTPNRVLVARLSSTNIIFGAEYKTNLAKKISEIPASNIQIA